MAGPVVRWGNAPMADNIRLGILGAGPIAALHTAAFREVEGIDLTLAISRTTAAAERFAAEQSIPRSTTIADLLERGAEATGIDAVLVVVPAIHMARIAADMASLGVPLLLEKPVGMSLAETEDAANRITVPHMVGLNRRFYDVIRRGREAIDAAGGARFIEIHMPEDIRALADRYGEETLNAWAFGNSVHLVDLFRVFAGETSGVRTNNEVRSYWDRSYSGLIDFESGARGVYNAQWYAPGPWRVTVYGDGITALFAPIEEGLILRMPGRQREEVKPQGPDTKLKAGFHGQAEAFRDLVRDGRLPEGAADMAEYLRSVRLVHELTSGD